MIPNLASLQPIGLRVVLLPAPSVVEQPEIIAAARAGDATAVRELLAAGADPNTRLQGSDINVPGGAGIPGRTALILAAYGGHVEVARELLAAGADVNLLDGGGFSALWVAASGNRLGVMNALLAVDGVDLNQSALLGRTACCEAAARGHVAIVERLLEAGADVELRDDYGRTALHWARMKAHGVIVRMMLQDFGAPE